MAKRERLPLHAPNPYNAASMRIRLHLLLFVYTLLGTGWPGTLLANVPAQLPAQVSSRPAFLLIATDRLADAWFRHSVILVTRHAGMGPLGVILNHPLNATLDQAFPAIAAAKEHRLFAGGPVFPQQLSFLFRSDKPAPGTLRISGQGQLASEPALLGELLEGTRPHSGLRVARGLAGWAPGQLEGEIARGDWYVLPVDEAAIFDIPVNELWKELYRRVTSGP